MNKKEKEMVESATGFLDNTKDSLFARIFAKEREEAKELIKTITGKEFKENE